MISVSVRYPLRTVLHVLLLLNFLVDVASAQDVKTHGPSITFSLDFPQSIPDHYQISVASDGQATYDSTGKLTPDSEPGDPFHLDFKVAPETAKRMFDLAAKARYFEGQVDSGKRNLASTGAKVLAYKDDTRNTRAAYNYSPVPAVQDITAMFQNMSSTLEFGRRLDYYHHHQKLALEEELKSMERMAREKNLEEIEAIAPILQKIAMDQSVLNITRARAQRLLSAQTLGASR